MRGTCPMAHLVKNPSANAEDVGSIPGSRRSRRKKWQAPPVLLSGKSHGQRSLVGYSPCGHKRVRLNDQTTAAMSSRRKERGGGRERQREVEREGKDGRKEARNRERKEERGKNGTEGKERTEKKIKGKNKWRKERKGEKKEERKERITITASGQQQQLWNQKTSAIRCDIYIDIGKSQMWFLVRYGLHLPCNGKPFGYLQPHICQKQPAQSNFEVTKAKAGIGSRSGPQEVHFEG